MKKVLFTLLIVAFFALPALAEEGAPAEAAASGKVLWGVLGAAFAIGLVGFAAALGQGKAIAAACDGLARNPGAAGPIRTTLLLGLAFIESIAIYALLIALLAIGK